MTSNSLDVNEDDVYAVMRRIDVGGTGIVSKDEFVRLMSIYYSKSIKNLSMTMPIKKSDYSPYISPKKSSRISSYAPMQFNSGMGLSSH
jgi:hypothetical protein